VNYAAAHEALAVALGDRPAIRWRGRTWPWSEAHERARRFAGALREVGIGTKVRRPVAPWDSGQDHIAICLTNGNEYLEAMVGSFLARAVPCNVNYRYVAHELIGLFADMRPAALVFHSSFSAVVMAVLDHIDYPPRLLLQVDDDPTVPLLPGALKYEAALAAAPPFTASDLEPDDRYAVFTGGTTGAPKGVLWRQDDFILGCLGVAQRDGSPFPTVDRLVERATSKEQVRALAAAPFMHGAAQWNALATWLSGGTVVIQQRPGSLDPSDLLDTLAEERCTSLAVVGDAFVAPLVDELRRQPRDLSALRVIRSGGAVLSPALKAALADLVPHARIFDVMGSSESGAIAVGEGGESSTFRPVGTTCVLSDDMTVRLDSSDQSLGWLANAGALPMGYLYDPDKTATTFPEIDGTRYVVVGDRAAHGNNGQLRVLGREATCVNTGGEKVFVEEVEQAIKAHRNVYDCLVVGRPHERWGNELVAIIALRRPFERGTELEDDLQKTASTRLARYKVPRAFVFVDTVVRLASGKPDYRWALQEALRPG
jgi:acyl-CoA synthetase (AMP-forming)/AMP-acid ligase II